MIVLGLTGSIGMGKTTAARFFAEEGAAVFSADDAAHAFYRDKAHAARLAAAFPAAVENGAVHRQKLAELLFAGNAAAQSQALAKLEALIHPYIRARERAFIRAAAARGHKLAVLDIPLLLESMEREQAAALQSGQEAGKRVDYIAVVSAPEAVQKARVMARPHMSEAKFAALSARQMSDAEKRRRADFVLDMGQGLAAAKAAVRALNAKLCGAAAS